MSEEDRTRKAEKPRRSRVLNIVMLVAIAAGAFILSNVISSVLGSGSSENPAATSGAGLVSVIAAIIISVFVVLSLHEVGHLIGGKLAGMRFMLFIVGPLKLQASQNGIKIHLNRSIAMAGGLAGTAPDGSSDSKNLRRRMAMMTAGGPVMSLVVAGVAYVLSGFVTGGFFGPLLFAVALMSAMICVVTLLPVNNGGFFTDGSRLLMLYRNGPEAKRWCALSALGGASVFGERPRDWDETLIAQSLSPADGTLDDSGASVNAAHRALDLGRYDEAKSLLERAATAEDVPGHIRHQTIMERAFFAAIFDDDPETARRLYSEVPTGATFEKHLALRVESAVLLAEGRTEEAREKARDSLKEISHTISPGLAKLEQEWLEEIEDGKSPGRLSPT